MSRRNRSAEEQARRAKIRELLQEGNISSMEDIQNLFKETIAEFMENGLDAELDEELGYSRYDYKSKNTDNSRSSLTGILTISYHHCTPDERFSKIFWCGIDVISNIKGHPPEKMNSP